MILFSKAEVLRMAETPRMAGALRTLRPLEKPQTIVRVPNPFLLKPLSRVVLVRAVFSLN
jgi:hypothetical protein